MKNLPLSLLSFLLLFLFACRSNPQLNEEGYGMPVTLPNVRYTQTDVQKLNWLAGAWQGTEAGRTVRKLFQFHGNNMLEMLDMDNENGSSVSLFTWHEGRYYLGQNRRWVLTWIGDKDLRFDPMFPGAEPMTWTRLNDRQWHLVRHTPGGDEATLMERREEMQP